MIQTRPPENNLVRLPAEWEEQSGILISWPHDETPWKKKLELIEPTYDALVQAISRFEPVLICCNDNALKTHVQNRLKQFSIPSERIFYVVCPTNDTWARDFGPICIESNGHSQMLDFSFNAWGSKYPFEHDNLITQTLWEKGCFSSCERISIPFILEGGSIDSDGQGSLLTSRSCLQNDNRTGDRSQSVLEETLQKYLGVHRVYWLNNSLLYGDDTDGHIDMLVRFVDPDTLAYTACTDPNDENAKSLHDLYKEIKTWRKENGEPFYLVPLPIPKPHYENGRRLAASYANFLIINDAVLIPAYSDPNDALVCERLQPFFPTREMVLVPGEALITQNGSVHCSTMQIPSAISVQPPRF